MPKFTKWMYANKVTITGLLALVLYVLDEIFNFSKSLHLSQEAYYGIASIIFILIGYAIKGRGFESIEQFQQAVELHKKLKESKTLEKKVEIVSNMVLGEENKTDTTSST